MSRRAAQGMRVRRAAALVIASAGAACRGVQSSLESAGSQAHRIEGLWWVMFWVCVAVFVAVLALLLVAVLRAAPETTAVTEPPRERRRTTAVAAGAAVTAAILFVFLVLSESTGRAIATPAGPDVLKIRVTGHQWWWQVVYPGRQPNEAVETANEIHLPVGRPVLLELTSSDVIHSFWAPTIHGKKDLIPGIVNTHVLQADRPGIFRGQCAEFCGLQHAHMAFTVIAEPEEKFVDWLTKQNVSAAEPKNDDERRGREVFLSSPCVLCHSIRGTGAGGRVAPDLTHIASRATLAAGTLPNNRGHLAGWILDPQSVKPGNYMPPNLLPAEDLQSLLAYLGSLQ